MLLVIKGKHFARTPAIKARQPPALLSQPSAFHPALRDGPRRTDIRPEITPRTPQALDFALTRCPAACDRFVDALGLKTAFALFLGRGAGAAKKKRGTEAAEDEEQRSVSVVASLFQGLGKGSRRDRLAAKFVEDDFAKARALPRIPLWTPLHRTPL